MEEAKLFFSSRQWHYLFKEILITLQLYALGFTQHTCKLIVATFLKKRISWLRVIRRIHSQLLFVGQIHVIEFIYAILKQILEMISRNKLRINWVTIGSQPFEL